MSADRAIEVQRELRGRIQRARAEMSDPHALGVAMVDDLYAVADGLQEYRAAWPLVAELGDTLRESCALIESLCRQVGDLKQERTALFGEGA